jgi:3-phenylpropionate/trans-cinnamate dioxygenase ferredoxin subunit
MSWTRACRRSEVTVGQSKAVNCDGEPLLVCRVTEDEFYVVADVCSHDEGPLAEGRLTGRVIECPRHGAQFDVTTGEVLRLPAASRLTTYPVRSTPDDWLEIDLEGDG